MPYNLKSTVQQTEEMSCAIEILLSLMYSRMVLMVVCCRYRMPFDGNGCVSTLMNGTFYAKMLIESDRSVNECRLNKLMDICVNEFGVSFNDSIFLVMNSKRCISVFG